MQKIKSVLTIVETEASIARAKSEKKTEDPENAQEIIASNRKNEKTSRKD